MVSAIKRHRKDIYKKNLIWLILSFVQNWDIIPCFTVFVIVVNFPLSVYVILCRLCLWTSYWACKNLQCTWLTGNFCYTPAETHIYSLMAPHKCSEYFSIITSPLIYFLELQNLQFPGSSLSNDRCTAEMTISVFTVRNSQFITQMVSSKKTHWRMDILGKPCGCCSASTCYNMARAIRAPRYHLRLIKLSDKQHVWANKKPRRA